MNARTAGCLFGMALGDAIGAETEFLSVAAILERFPPNGPEAPPSPVARVTDDTQMALAVGEALLNAPRPYTPEGLGRALTRSFTAWYDDPENNRAPGMTCLRSIERLMTGQRWQEATTSGSKGCGANMRVQPVGLLPADAVERAQIAQFQAALTHGHPTALAASDLTAWAIADLAGGGDPGTLLKRMRTYGESQRRVYHEVWLGDLYQRAMLYSTGEAFMARGWDEVLEALERVEAALATPEPPRDPCLLTGAGWIAEEALATALYCFLQSPADAVAVVRRAALSSGDSDSIACIAGAFAGAHLGLESWPAAWIERVEYADGLRAIAAGLSAMG